jgi:phosphoribosylformylglycinamidine (FGAM) synthase-like amidotransferase family enzyme
MLVPIKFIRSGANSRLGGFSHGDRARVDAAFAAHLVDIAKVAEYVEAPAEKPATVKKAKK